MHQNFFEIDFSQLSRNVAVVFVVKFIIALGLAQQQLLE